MQALSQATQSYLRAPRLDGQDRLHLEATGKKGEVLTHFVANFFRSNKFYDDGIGPPAHNVFTWASQFPESKRLERSGHTLKYEFPNTDMFVERCANAFHPENDNCTFENVETEAMFMSTLMRGQLADRVAENYARFKDSNFCPQHDLTLHPDFPLKLYQQVAAVNGGMLGRYGFFMDMGTGKTAIVIALICNEAVKFFNKTGRPIRVIIIAPKNVRMNWESEFHKFATCPGKIEVLRGTRINRIRQLVNLFRNEPDFKPMFNIAICSYETLSRSWEALGASFEANNQRWTFGILDEAHYIKNHDRKRSEYCHRLRDICERRYILTGTPITNTGLDLFSQLEYLEKGLSGFYTWTAFRRFYGRYITDNSGQQRLDGLQNVPFMQERLARYSFFVRSEEVQTYLPEKIYNVIECSMSDTQRTYYKDLRDQLALEIEADLLQAESNRELVVQNSLVKLLRLAQITSGYLGLPEIRDEITDEILQPASSIDFTPNPKLEELIRVIRESGKDDKIIIWTNWVHNINIISQRLTEEKIKHVVFYGSVNEKERELAKKIYNEDPDCKVWVGNPGAGGEGVNLLGYPIPGQSELYKQLNPETGELYVPGDFKTDTAYKIYYSQDWSVTKRKQSEKRGHREGTRKPIRILDLSIPRTIDQEIRERVIEKHENAMELSDISEILNNVLRGDFTDD